MPKPKEPHFTGLYSDDISTESYWIREKGTVRLPQMDRAAALVIGGELLASLESDQTTHGKLGLEISIDNRIVHIRKDLAIGQFRVELPWPTKMSPTGARLEIRLVGVTYSNSLAWLGRISGLSFLQGWRKQGLNRRLRIQRIESDKDILFDFSNRSSPWNRAIFLRNLPIGLNLVGYFRAVLGVGESVRCAARAAEAAALPFACVDLKLPCRNSLSDDSYKARLQSDNPHQVNVIHVDAPGMRDIDHHHGEVFRRGKYNIGYWAWELPEFPDAWTHFAEYCDEIWTPSRFVTDAISQKLPIPVLTMPHAISFDRPQGDFRAKFGLPASKYLFLFLYDLNSYSARKNPMAVLEAFRASGLAGQGAALVIKVHNGSSNPQDLAHLETAISAIPDTTLITQTLSRQELYELENACDCFVSLHRSEGFGLAVAECMYLGKPVISTDWSATAEFVHLGNGCPVRCRQVVLDQNYGPYSKGQVWAEPDVMHAADWMRRLYENPQWGQTLGAAARTTIEQQFSPSAIGSRYRRRLESIASWRV